VPERVEIDNPRGAARADRRDIAVPAPVRHGGHDQPATRALTDRGPAPRGSALASTGRRDLPCAVTARSGGDTIRERARGGHTPRRHRSSRPLLRGAARRQLGLLPIPEGLHVEEGLEERLLLRRRDQANFDIRVALDLGEPDHGAPHERRGVLHLPEGGGVEGREGLTPTRSAHEASACAPTRPRRNHEASTAESATPGPGVGIAHPGLRLLEHRRPEAFMQACQFGAAHYQEGASSAHVLTLLQPPAPGPPGTPRACAG
jgi:hypothetical protein